MRAAPMLLCVTMLQAWVPAARAQPSEERVARGMKLLQMQGCTGCHSLDGRVSAGPTFAARFGTQVQVLRDGKLTSVRFDRDYLRRSLLEPQADVAAGFAPGVMPTFALTEEQLEAIAAALEQLASAPPAPPEPGAVPWAWLALALAGLGGTVLLLRKRRSR